MGHSYPEPEPLYSVQKINETCLVLLPKNETQHYSKVLIWLTGLEEAPEDFEGMFNYNPYLLPNPKNTKIIIMSGEMRTVTGFKVEKSPYGDQAYSWFDVLDFNDVSMSSINFDDVKKSAERIIKVIEEESKYLGGYQNIFLGGFSQGACMSLYIGCGFNHLLGGVICCSGALFPDAVVNNDNNKLKIFISHGDLDDHISKDVHVLSLNKINNFTEKEIHYYPSLGHIIEDYILNDLSIFFNKYMK